MSIGLVDDHPLMIEALVGLLTRSQRFKIAATGASARDIMDIATDHQPQVMIVDLNMPGDVYGAISSVAGNGAKSKIIAFTAAVGVEPAIRALNAGVTGYVLKGSETSELLQAIDTVQRGETYLAQSFSGQIISALRDNAMQRAAAQAVRLSVREIQIVRLLLRGQTNREIATALKISEKTVKHYMTILMQKLKARNRLEVVIAAQRIGQPNISMAPQFGRM